MFKTSYNFKDDYFTTSGTHTIDINEAKKSGEKKVEIGYEYTYDKQYDKKGNRILVISGRVNTYDKIQSFKDDVDIYKIIARYTNGDLSVLDKNKGFYFDATDIPKSFNDYHNKFVEGQKIFDSLPIDFKNTFGNNINQFMNSIYDKTFDLRYNDYVKSKVVKPGNNVSNNVDNNKSNEVGGEKNDK